jgi:polysaccharide biosynthesis/export protein
MNLFRLLLSIPVLILFVSCGSQKKVPVNYNYLQAVTDTGSTKLNPQVSTAEYVIQKYDVLSIVIYSDATRKEVDELYNMPAASGNGNSGTTGYLVDATGMLQLPRVGAFKGEGLTKSQLAEQIRAKLIAAGQLVNPLVIIRLLNYQISVLGEVQREGVYNIPNENVTLLQAIALAGGITVDGKKTTVKVLREVNGKRETGMVDMTAANLFESPYYNLMQNDVVMVEMTKRKARQTDQQNTIQKASFFVGVITAFVLVYNTFNRNN